MRFIRRRLLSAALLGCGSVAAARATDPADQRLAMEARQSLGADARLAGLNLGVTVKNGEATLYGPVPSEELSRRAEVRVRVVTGMRNVYNDLHVTLPGDPVLKNLARALEKAEAANKDVPEPVVTLDPAGQAMLPPKPRFLPDAAVSTQFSLASSSAEPIMIAPVLADPAKDIGAICRRDARFQGLRVKCERGVVSISGSLKKWSDLWEFADLASHVAGVERVRIEKVSLEK